MKDKDVMKQIEDMLKDISVVDQSQHIIIMSLLNEVYREYNSGVKRRIDNKLWELIDAEVKLQLRNS